MTLPLLTHHSWSISRSKRPSKPSCRERIKFKQIYRHSSCRYLYLFVFKRRSSQ
uniref:Candidate secreted effector n=1 Tax=Meloidogyne incognita TaxID=6306 RepID=A0A914KTZ5_MELIC